MAGIFYYTALIRHFYRHGCAITVQELHNFGLVAVIPAQAGISAS